MSSQFLFHPCGRIQHAGQEDHCAEYGSQRNQPFHDIFGLRPDDQHGPDGSRSHGHRDGQWHHGNIGNIGIGIGCHGLFFIGHIAVDQSHGGKEEQRAAPDPEGIQCNIKGLKDEFAEEDQHTADHKSRQSDPEGKTPLLIGFPVLGHGKEHGKHKKGSQKKDETQQLIEQGNAHRHEENPF